MSARRIHNVYVRYDVLTGDADAECACGWKLRERVGPGDPAIGAMLGFAVPLREHILRLQERAGEGSITWNGVYGGHEISQTPFREQGAGL